MPLRGFRLTLLPVYRLKQHPLNASETEGAERANARLDDARDAFVAGDLEEVRERISAAIWDTFNSRPKPMSLVENS